MDNQSLRNKIKPIVVAVIDTGVFEAHLDLRHKMLIDQSRCFVAGKLSRVQVGTTQLSIEARLHSATRNRARWPFMEIYGDDQDILTSAKITPPPKPFVCGRCIVDWCGTSDQLGSFPFHVDDVSQTDLRRDVCNHGTLVAGIIALNGPINVKIINLKVHLQCG